MFEKFLKADIDRVNHTIVDGQTLLIIAIKHGHYEIVEFLIKKCNVNIEQVGVLFPLAILDPIETNANCVLTSKR